MHFGTVMPKTFRRYYRKTFLVALNAGKNFLLGVNVYEYVYNVNNSLEKTTFLHISTQNSYVYCLTADYSGEYIQYVHTHRLAIATFLGTFSDNSIFGPAC